jgi:hypothetical protein
MRSTAVIFINCFAAGARPGSAAIPTNGSNPTIGTRRRSRAEPRFSPPARPSDLLPLTAGAKLDGEFADRSQTYTGTAKLQHTW